MKKIVVLLFIFFIAFTLGACQKKDLSPIVISKIFDATLQSNNIIELYNPSDKDINLSGYVLNFYTNGSLEVSVTIPISGTIEASSYFAIGSSNSDNSTAKALYDFSYEEGSLPYNGNDAIELMYKKTVIDYVGLVGSDVDFSRDLTMIRLGNKEEYKPSKTFNKFSFIYYLPDMFQYLKNDDHEIKTLEDLYAGPRLEQRYKDMPYVDPTNNTIGGGGAVLTTLVGVADGDTAFFNASNGFEGGSVRYFYLNTPEVDGSHVSAEPWGYVASKYNKEYLLSNATEKEIHIQSVKGYALKEVHTRSIGLVWINGYLSQFLIVSEGLSEDVGLNYTASDLEMHYKNVPYLTFLRFAENRAKQNKWATKGFPTVADGEKAPDWNYETNRNTTAQPVWTPHLPLPWE